MMLLSLILWTTLVSAFVLAWKSLRLQIMSTRAACFFVGLYAIVWLFFASKHDEEVEAGEDPAAYLFSGQALVEQGKFRLCDPAFERLSESSRPLFRHGHPGFRLTKNIALWFTDVRMDRAYPWFPPAYPLLLGIFMAGGVPKFAYWATAVIAALCGLLTSGIARHLSGRREGFGYSLVLYLLHPAVAWNLRSIRAEWPASLSVLAGLVLLFVSRDREESERKLMSLLKGGLAGITLGISLLFHITAFFVLLPTMLAAAILTRLNRWWVGWWMGIVFGYALFLLQTLFVTDPYGLRDQLASVPQLLWIVVPAFGFVMVIALKTVRVKLGDKFWKHSFGALAVLLLILVAWIWKFREPDGRLPGMPAWTAPYLSLTDFSVLGALMSPLALGVGMLGWPLMLRYRRQARWFFSAMVFAFLAGGWTVYLMFESRRFVAFIVPFWVWGATYVAVCASQWAGRFLSMRSVGKLLGIAISLCVLVSMMWGRTAIYRTHNYRGAICFYQQVAEAMKQHADFLITEYTQVGTPLEFFSKLPVLPLSWEYRSDNEYRAAETAIKDLIRCNPGERFALIAPFPGALLSDKPYCPGPTYKLRSERLERTKKAIPSKIIPWERSLHVVWLSGSDSAWCSPYIRTFPGTRLGLEGAAARMLRRSETYRLSTWSHAVSRWMAEKKPGDLVLVFWKTKENETPLANVRICSHRCTPLANGWNVSVIGDGEKAASFIADSPCVSSVYLLRQDGTFSEVTLDSYREEVRFENEDSQWLLDRGRVAIPKSSRAWVAVLARSGAVNRPDTRVAMLRYNNQLVAEIPLTTEWTWRVFQWPESLGQEGISEWISWEVFPPYDPADNRYPSNLGLQIQTIVVIPPLWFKKVTAETSDLHKSAL